MGAQPRWPRRSEDNSTLCIFYTLHRSAVTGLFCHVGSIITWCQAHDKVKPLKGFSRVNVQVVFFPFFLFLFPKKKQKKKNSVRRECVCARRYLLHVHR